MSEPNWIFSVAEIKKINRKCDIFLRSRGIEPPPTFADLQTRTLRARFGPEKPKPQCPTDT